MSQAMARERDKLFETLKSAPDERSGRQAENAIWQFWVRSAPTPEIEARLTEAMRARSSYDFETARGILDEVIRNAPDYAEGWNQRAFILFLQNKPDKSLEDIDRCLELEPRHFGALAGKANILMMQGRVELAQKALRQAIDIHPWLKERRMLLEPKGEKI
ncbi:tetratricopeptide repeat protein [Breoghania sp. L-A4]|uniref:tetratricopeptide repeat protein n=1 Tax=Breoghania sp. L-A4 TaxID=2304600 RepID=UPI0013C2E9CE|nr:tetratricopeptide repeat protein [Breoghania sp. L-A4]